MLEFDGIVERNDIAGNRTDGEGLGVPGVVVCCREQDLIAGLPASVVFHCECGVSNVGRRAQPCPD